MCNMRSFLPFRLRMAVWSVLIATLMAAAVPGQSDDDDDELPTFRIVIFSPAVDNSRRSLTQSVVWSSFVERLKTRTAAISVVNEVAINDVADRARALELARDFEKHTIWLQFSAMNASTTLSDDRRETPDSELLVAKYVVFAPLSNDILSAGDVEQERVVESTFQSLSKGANARRRGSPLPDGSNSAGPKTMDLDSLKRVGTIVADRALSSVKKKKKK